MHLVPAEQAHRRLIDDHRACDAIGGIGDSVTVAQWAARYALLGDRNRLTLLLAIHRAGPISVSDLAVAAGLKDTTVSQALRHLRAAGSVATERDGRIVRYRLADTAVADLLERVVPSAPHVRAPNVSSAGSKPR